MKTSVVLVLLAAATLVACRQLPKQNKPPKIAEKYDFSSAWSSEGSDMYMPSIVAGSEFSWDSSYMSFDSSYWGSSYSSSYGSSGATPPPNPVTTKPPGPPPATNAPSGTCKCGLGKPSRIVGGTEVNPRHKYPYQVGIKNRGGTTYWCGGSIINNRYVLTAAHCITGEEASDLLVGIGDHLMSSTSDNVAATEMVGVEKIIADPQYNSNTMDHDIALLKLSKTLTFSADVNPVCLPADDSKTYAGAMGIASGWGTLSSGGKQPNALQEVSLPILDPKCWGQSVTARMLCAGYTAGGKDTCQGDSGGPLVITEGNRYFQVGVTSFGDGCAKPNSPGVYARVSKFLSFIKSNTQDAVYCQAS